MSPLKRPSLAQWRAAILHRPHTDVDALSRQLQAMHMQVEVLWPEMPKNQKNFDVIFFDADRGYDGQLPWETGQSPAPMIALIGSEAPGRVEWALRQGANAHLLKPIRSTGVYSALLIAAHAFEISRRQQADIQDLQNRLRQRPVILRAVIGLMRDHAEDEIAAFQRLRALAMNWRVTIEEAAEIICDHKGDLKSGA